MVTIASILDPLVSLPGGKSVGFVLLLTILLFIGHVLSLLIRYIVFYLSRKAKKTLDEEIIKNLRGPLFAFFAFTAVQVSIAVFFQDISIFGMSAYTLYIILISATLAVAINRIIDAILVWYGTEITPSGDKKRKENKFLFVRNVIKILVYIAFLIIILDRLGIQVAPLIAGLGVAGLAVALALQDTLSNFFAGLHILADKPVREGDFVRLEEGLEGKINYIGWRSTKLLTLDNNTIIIPNSKLAQSTIVNFSTPIERLIVSYEIGVGYEEDIDNVSKVILDTIKKVQKTNSEFVKDFEPSVRFERFGDYSLIFRYEYKINNYQNRNRSSGAINRELFYAFKKHAIAVPFQVHTVYSDKKPKKKR